MRLALTCLNQGYQLDTKKPLDISIGNDFSTTQVNHFNLPLAKKHAFNTGEDTSCTVSVIDNYIPHAHGTHTESVQHVLKDGPTIASLLEEHLFLTELVTVTPVSCQETDESYPVTLNPDEKIITKADLQSRLHYAADAELHSLVIRTTPNAKTKKNQHYVQNGDFPFFSTEAMRYLHELQINHLLVDMPSIDRMYDDGKLSNHHLFWQTNDAPNFFHRTLTELVYVEDTILDGLYLLDLQFVNLALEAVPSRPQLYKLEEHD